MTGLVFLIMCKGNDYDLFQMITISFLMDFALLVFFIWTATMHNMWAIYLINIIYDIPILGVYKKYYKWKMSTFMYILIPDIYWLVLALVCK